MIKASSTPTKVTIPATSHYVGLNVLVAIIDESCAVPIDTTATVIGGPLFDLSCR